MGQPSAALIAIVRQLIVLARAHVAAPAHSILTLLYWHIDRRVAQDVHEDARADCGRETLATLSRESIAQFGNGVLLDKMTGERSRPPRIQRRHFAPHAAWQ